jgi:hypothetical protein
VVYLKEEDGPVRCLYPPVRVKLVGCSTNSNERARSQGKKEPSKMGRYKAGRKEEIRKKQAGRKARKAQGHGEK